MDAGRSFLAKGILTAGLRGLTLASRVLLAFVLARLLLPEELGQFGLLSALIAFGMLAVGLEFYTFANRELVTASTPERVRMLRSQFTLYALAYPLALIAALAAGWIGLVPPGLLIWLAPLLIVEHASQESFRILISLSRPLAANVVLFVRTGAWVYIAAALLFAAEPLRTLSTVFVVWLVGSGGSLLLAFLFLRDLDWAAARRAGADWGWIRHGLWRARYFMVTAAAALSLSYIDRFFIEAHIGIEALGVYTLFSSFANGLLSLITSAISHQFLPRVIGARNEGWLTYRRVLAVFLASNVTATALIVLLAALAIGPLLQLVGREIYAANVGIYFVLIAAAGLRAVCDVPGYALYAAHSDRALLATNLAAAALAITLNALLIPRLGLTGAAYAALAAAVLLLLLQSGLAIRRLMLDR